MKQKGRFSTSYLEVRARVAAEEVEEVFGVLNGEGKQEISASRKEGKNSLQKSSPNLKQKLRGICRREGLGNS